MYNAFVELLV